MLPGAERVSLRVFAGLCFAAAGQKGSDVTAREATRKMVAAATQLDALQQIVARIDAIAVEHSVQLVHMARPASASTAASAATHHGLAAVQEDGGVREELVPRSAAAVVQPNKWQPKNTIVRSAYREASSQVVAQRAAGPLAAAAAVAPVAPPDVAQSMAAAAAAAAAAAGASPGGSASLPYRHVLQTPQLASAPIAAAAAAGPVGNWSPAPAGAETEGRRELSSLSGAVHSNSSSHNGGGTPTGGYRFGSPAHRGSSSGGGGRHSQPVTPVNCPLVVVQEGAAPEDTLMAAVQQLAEAQTPRHTHMHTPRRAASANRRSSTGG